MGQSMEEKGVAEMKNAMYISQKPAFPIVDGGSNAVASFLLNFREIWKGKLSYFPITTPKHPCDLMQLQGLLENVPIIPLEIDSRISSIGFLLNIKNSDPYNVKRYKKSAIRNELLATDKLEAFDTVICDGFYAACLIPEDWFHNKNIVYRAHNVESNIWKSKTKLTSGMKKIILNKITRRMRVFENDLLQKFNQIIAISENDASYFRQFNTSVSTLLPTSEIKKFESFSFPLELCFIGDFEWEPNKDGIEHFIENIFPKLKKEIPELSLHLAGRFSEIFHQPNQGIYAYGFVANSKGFLSKHGVFIAPLRYGSGLNIKVMEALCIGKEAILNKESCKGIQGIENLCIAETDADYLKIVQNILFDNDKRLDLQNQAMKVAEKNFSNEKQIQQMKNLFHGS